MYDSVTIALARDTRRKDKSKERRVCALSLAPLLTVYCKGKILETFSSLAHNQKCLKSFFFG